MLHTSTGGDPWTKIDLPGRVPTVDWLYAHLTTGSFPDLDTAYVAGSDSLSGAARKAFLLRTTDAGLTWSRLPLPPAPQVDDVRFRDGRHGVVLDGTGGRVLVTADGGQSWQVVPLGATAPLHAICWADAQTLYAVGESSNAFTSTDAGLTWQPFTNLMAYLTQTGGFWPVGYLVTVRFTSPLVGCVSTTNTILATTDGGQTWTSFDLFTPGVRWATDYAFSPSGQWWAVSESELYASADSGRTWALDSSFHAPVGLYGGTYHFYNYCAARADRYNGWQAGEHGVIARYSQKMIRTQPVTGVPLGPGAQLTVPFTTTGVFAPAEQDFRVELSNAMGRFRPGQTQLIGQGTASPLLATVPAGLPVSARYRVRVVRTDASVLGTASSQRLTLGRSSGADPAVAFQVFPNPARGRINVRMPGGPRGGALTLTDATGRVVWRGTLTAPADAVPLTGLPAGVYQLVLTLPDGRSAGRPVVVAGE